MVDAVAEIGDQLELVARRLDQVGVDRVGDRGHQHVGVLNCGDELVARHRDIFAIEARVEQFGHAIHHRIAQLARHDHPRFALGPGHMLGLAASRVLVNAVDAPSRLRNRYESVVA